MNKLFTSIFLLMVLVHTVSMSQESRSLTYDGEERHYLLHLPVNYNGEQNLPLVLNLHGFGSTDYDQQSYTSFDAIADTARCIVIYPQGLVRTIDTGQTGEHWNAYFGTDVDDKGFLVKLVDIMKDEFNIDPGRVYVAGYSNGGYMAYLLGCEASETFAAIASVSGNMVFAQIPNCSPTNPVSVLHIHGTEDKTVAYSGSSRSAGVPEVIQTWLDLDDCETTNITEEQLPDIDPNDNSTVSRYEYLTCSFNADVELYKVSGGGHTWPGASFERPDLGNTNHDINASVVIWNFFRKHRNTLLVAGSDDSIENPIEVFPTEFNETLTIRNVANGNKVEIFSSTGQIIKSATITSQNYHLSTSDIGSGLYLLRVLQTNGPEKTFRVIKNQ